MIVNFPYQYFEDNRLAFYYFSTKVIHQLYLRRLKKLTDLEIEIEDLEFDLLDARKALHECRPLWQENHLKQEGRFPVGDIPRADLEKRVDLLQKKLIRKKSELDNLKAKLVPQVGEKFKHGELKAEVERLAKRDGYKTGKSVDGKIRRKWLKEMASNGKITTDAAIRAVLSNLTITKERPPKN